LFTETSSYSHTHAYLSGLPLQDVEGMSNSNCALSKWAPHTRLTHHTTRLPVSEAAGSCPCMISHCGRKTGQRADMPPDTLSDCANQQQRSAIARNPCSSCTDFWNTTYKRYLTAYWLPASCICTCSRLVPSAGKHTNIGFCIQLNLPTQAGTSSCPASTGSFH
jgi:hypothetical protein